MERELTKDNKEKLIVEMKKMQKASLTTLLNIVKKDRKESRKGLGETPFLQITI